MTSPSLYASLASHTGHLAILGVASHNASVAKAEGGGRRPDASARIEGWIMVYFIQEDRPAGLIKIGYAKRDAKKRISLMQTGNPAELTILCVIAGGRAFETELHKRFKKFRVGILRFGRKRIYVRGECQTRS